MGDEESKVLQAQRLEKDRRTISACPVVYFLRKSDDKKDQRVERRIKNRRQEESEKDGRDG
jgi:hypothetical protein